MAIKKRFIFYITAIVITLLLCLVFIEISYVAYKKIIKKESIKSDHGGIDFHIAGMFVKDKEAGYALKPNTGTSDLPRWEERRDRYDAEYHGLGKRISTNSAGYRGTLYTVEKPDNTIRILTLGGSTTWGTFNDDGKTWPDYLEKILLDKVEDKKIQVINGAVGGYTFAQNLEMVKKKFQFYKPDIILIACWFNDMYNRAISSGASFPTPDMDFDVTKSLKEPRERFKYPFQGGRVLYKGFRNLTETLRFKLTTSEEYRNSLNNPPKSFFKKYYPENKIWINNYLSNISKIIFICKKAQPDAEIFIIAMPTFFVPASAQEFKEKLDLPDYDIAMYHNSYRAKNMEDRFWFAMYYHHTILFQEFLQNRAEKMGYGLIPGYTELGKIPLEKRNKYFCDVLHLTDNGNFLLAEDIAHQLLKLSNKFK